ncbi:MAG: GAF domain-containing protein, partial [Anaerolineales bacterium]|nr:GAF domain-containing protein [Anaerolineales bacterium]
MTDLESMRDHLAFLRATLIRLQGKVEKPLRAEVKKAQKSLDQLFSTLVADDGKERLSVLYEVSRAIGSSLQLDEVLNHALDAVIQLTGAERGFLVLVDELTDHLDLKVARNFEGISLDENEMQVSRSIIQEVVRTGEGVVTTDAQTDDRFAQRESVELYSLRSILCVPLRARGETTGVVYVENKLRSGIFREHDRELLQAFATQAAVAIQNARLFTQTDAALAERVEELETLQRIDRELNAGFDLDRVLELTLDWAVHGSQADTGWIAICSDEGPTFTIAVGQGKGTVLDPGSDNIRPAVHAGEAVFEYGGDLPAAKLVVPARRAGNTIALIGVQRQDNPFTPIAESFLQRLAEHAAVAIENNRLYRALQQANQAKSQFVSQVSHELKTPMTSIAGYADLIRKGTVGPVTDRQAQFLETIRTNIDRMETLVSDLSDISRIETGQLRIELRDVDLSESILEATESMRPQFKAKGQRIHFELPSTIAHVRTDRVRLMQILSNLLSNANKFTPRQGEISVSAQAQNDGTIRVSVKDTGIGISEEDMANLFAQFFRADDPAVHDQHGWGLGLNVTRRLVELLGGEIGVESTVGEGSTFWFTLPV